MNFVNQTYTQVVDLFRSMTPAARITAALLLAVVVIGLAYLFHLQTSGSDEYIYGGREFSQSEIGDMETAFAKAGLSKWEVVGNRIRAPRGLKDKYLAALADGGATPPDSFDHVVEAHKQTNPFESPRTREDRLKTAKERELSLVISKMKGIRAATVQIDEIDKGFPKRKQRTASVAVQPQGNGPLDDERIAAIRTHVVATVAGLESAHVAITDLGSGKSYPGVGPDGQSSIDSVYAQHKRIFENDMKAKIIDQLAMYPGVVVGVNVELNNELNSHKQMIKYEPKAVPLEITESSKESTSTAPGPGGRPGAVPNGVGSNAPAQVASTTAGATSQTTEARNDQKAVTGQEQTNIHLLGLTPKRVTASIGLPVSYFTKVWRERHPTAPGATPKDPDPAELRKIEDDTKAAIETSVVNLFPPVPAGVDKYPLVNVTTYTDFPQPPEKLPTVTDQATSWMAGNWQTLAMVGVGLFSLVMLRGMLRPGPSTTPPASAMEGVQAPQLAAVSEGDESADEEGQPARKRRFRSTGSSLRDELTDMVKEDPNAAINVLRNWIGDAA